MQIGLGLSITAQLRFGSSLSSYAVNDFDPSLVFDFEQNYYRTGGEDSTLSSSVTHSASSNATMTDSDGNIKWRPHNLVKYSEQFDNSYWNKNNCSITANNITSPSGVQDADKLTINVTGSNSYLRLTYAPTSSATYTASVWAKAGATNFLRMRSLAVNNNGGTENAWFNLSNGTVGTVQASLTASIEDFGNGWYLCSVTGSTIGTVGAPYVDLDCSSVDNSVSATLGNSIYIWGFHTYRSDLGGMVDNSARGDSYVPTTSSAVYLPRVGHHIYNGNAWVNEGVLHESEARTNRVTYSNHFTAWSSVNGGVNPAKNVTGLDGLTSAWTLTDASTSNRSGISFANSSSATGTFTASVFVKKDNDESRFPRINFYTPAGASISSVRLNTKTGALFVASATNSLSSVVEDMGDFWRVSLGLTDLIGENKTIRIFPADSNTIDGTESNASTGSIVIFGAQLEAGSTPSSYIPTSGSTVTRAAETLTVPAANMPYPETVYTSGELVTNGTFDTDSNWTKGTGWTISGGIATAQGGVSDTKTLEQDIGLVGGKLYYYSFDVGGTVSGSNNLFLRFGANVNSLNITSSGTKSGILVAAGSGNLIFRSDAETADITLDNISFKEINPLSVSIQMNGRMTYADNNVSTANSDVGGEVTFVRWKLNNSNWLGSMINAKSPRVGQVNFRQKYSGALDYTQTADDYYNYANNPVSFNIASRHGSTFINGATDGTALTANTTPTGLPDLSATNLHLGYRFMGTIGKFRMWSEDLTDTGIVTASAPSTEPSLQLTFDGSSTSSFTVLDWSE